jgi:acyl carrier protein
MEDFSFEHLANFVRKWASVPKKKEITPETLFEKDLGITGDDGADLLSATEKEFGISLSSEERGYRETFNLGPKEYLFNSEGWAPWELTTLFGTSTVREFTIGELYYAVRKALETKQLGVDASL